MEEDFEGDSATVPACGTFRQLQIREGRTGSWSTWLWSFQMAQINSLGGGDGGGAIVRAGLLMRSPETSYAPHRGGS